MIKKLSIKRIDGDYFTSHFSICHKCGVQINSHKHEMRYTVGSLQGVHGAGIKLNSNYATLVYTDYCAKCFKKVLKFFR
jgi:hypothetical protein